MLISSYILTPTEAAAHILISPSVLFSLCNLDVTSISFMLFPNCQESVLNDEMLFGYLEEEDHCSIFLNNTFTNNC